MRNQEILDKMKKDMKMRNFSKYTYDSYVGKTKDMLRYFKGKSLERVTTDELRDFLLRYLKEERQNLKTFTKRADAKRMHSEGSALHRNTQGS